MEKFKKAIKEKENNNNSDKLTQYEKLKEKIKKNEENYERTNNYFYRNKFEMNINEINNYSKELSNIMIDLASLQYQLTKLRFEINLELASNMRNSKLNEAV